MRSTVEGLWARRPTVDEVLDGLGRRWVLIVLAVLVMAALAANMVIGRAVDAERAELSAGQDALASAEARVPLMLSYDYRTIEDDAVVASGNATGTFRDEFAAALLEDVAPGAVSQQVVTEAQVVSAGVVKADRDTATVLLMISQATQQGATPPTTSGVRVLATMAHTDDGWFVSGLEPI